MKSRTIVASAVAALVVGTMALGQRPGPPNQQPAAAPSGAQQATVETADVSLVFPDRYAVPVVLEANRRVFLVAANDGVLKSVAAPVGTNVREAGEIAQLDRAEATAKYKIATANVKEAKAEAAKGDAAAAARLDAAEARAELAQLELDRCTLRAPFPGKILAAPVSPAST